MNKIIYDVLDKIEQVGFNAFIVGGFVRDSVMNMNSYDVDICTNALPKDVKEIFNINKESNLYGSINFSINNYNFDITTFRKEKNYKKRRPTEVEFIKDLKEDLNRRDFTMNSLCLDKNSNLIDYLDGKSDILNKQIKLIGDNIRLKEDPLRILRAIRFSTIYDFEIDDSLNDGIVMYKEYIKELSLERIKSELDKILINKNFLKGLNLLKKYGILKLIGIEYSNNIKYVPDLCGMYAQIKLDIEYPFTKEEKKNIKLIKKITTGNVIDNKILYKYGLYISSVAGKILNYKNDEIVSMYDKLPIYSSKDLDIDFKEIQNTSGFKEYKDVKILQELIINEILDNKLVNKKDKIIKYIRQGDERK